MFTVKVAASRPATAEEVDQASKETFDVYVLMDKLLAMCDQGSQALFRDRAHRARILNYIASQGEREVRIVPDDGGYLVAVEHYEGDETNGHYEGQKFILYPFNS